MDDGKNLDLFQEDVYFHGHNLEFLEEPSLSINDIQRKSAVMQYLSTIKFYVNGKQFISSATALADFDKLEIVYSSTDSDEQKNLLDEEEIALQLSLSRLLDRIAYGLDLQSKDDITNHHDLKHDPHTFEILGEITEGVCKFTFKVENEAYYMTWSMLNGVKFKLVRSERNNQINPNHKVPILRAPLILLSNLNEMYVIRLINKMGNST